MSYYILGGENTIFPSLIKKLLLKNEGNTKNLFNRLVFYLYQFNFSAGNFQDLY